MKLNVLKNVEKQMNLVMFLFNVGIPIVAFFYVLLFLEGTSKDAIIFVMLAAGVFIKLLEKPLGGAAKFLNVSVMPLAGVLTIVFANDGRFGAMTQAYFLALILSIAYYNKMVVVVCGAVTIAANTIGLILFTDSFLLMHNLPLWIFIILVFLLGTVTSYIIAGFTYKLFEKVQLKEEETQNLVQNITHAVDNLTSSSANIYQTLDQFNGQTSRIAANSKEIASNSVNQTAEVSDSLNMFNDLSDKLLFSENKIARAMESMVCLKENNGTGISYINELTEKFDENIKSTQQAADEIETLSEQSKSISSIIGVIDGISQQTNLLALNAAIEAARAGKAGKGFSVVADEIKQLSEQSFESTKRIDEILKEVIAVVEKARDTMSHNKSIVKISSQRLNATVDVFKDMTASSQEVIDITEALNSEMKKITDLKNHLLESMKKLACISENSATSTKEVSASIEDQLNSIRTIMQSMGNIQGSMENLSGILNNKQTEAP